MLFGDASSKSSIFGPGSSIFGASSGSAGLGAAEVAEKVNIFESATKSSGGLEKCGTISSC